MLPSTLACGPLASLSTEIPSFPSVLPSTLACSPLAPLGAGTDFILSSPLPQTSQTASVTPRSPPPTVDVPSLSLLHTVVFSLTASSPPAADLSVHVPLSSGMLSHPSLFHGCH